MTTEWRSWPLMFSPVQNDRSGTPSVHSGAKAEPCPTLSKTNPDCITELHFGQVGGCIVVARKGRRVMPGEVPSRVLQTARVYWRAVSAPVYDRLQRTTRRPRCGVPAYSSNVRHVRPPPPCRPVTYRAITECFRQPVRAISLTGLWSLPNAYSLARLNLQAGILSNNPLARFALPRFILNGTPAQG